MLSSGEKTSTAKEAASPPFSPVSFVIERPVLEPRVEYDLRQACAKITQESASSGSDLHELLNHHERLQKHIEDRNAKNVQRSERAQPNGDPETIFTRRNRRDASGPEPSPHIQLRTNPRNVPKASSFARQHQIPCADDVHFEPLEPTHTTVSATNRQRKPISDDPLSQIRAELDTRPKTSAAACVDYNGPSAGTSASTTRTNTTYDLRPSTGLTSLALTPADRKSASSAHQRVSEQVLRDTQAASVADEKAKAWMSQELARRRANSTTSLGPRPLSRQTSQSLESARPQSRSGSLREGIREYIRPKASMESMRSTRSETNLSRSDSHGSSGKSGSWWRGGVLRRKGSWSSFRSARPEDEEQAHVSGGKERGLDLNRTLPPLPGLDQYKEKKPTPMHISQLMRPTGNNSTNAGNRPAPLNISKKTVIDDDGLERTLSGSQRRQQRLQQLVEEKMRLGAISPNHSPRNSIPPPTRSKSENTPFKTTSPAPHTPKRSHTQQQPRRSEGKAAAVTVQEVSTPSTKERKSSWGKRISKILHGTDKTSRSDKRVNISGTTAS